MVLSNRVDVESLLVTGVESSNVVDIDIITNRRSVDDAGVGRAAGGRFQFEGESNLVEVGVNDTHSLRDRRVAIEEISQI